MVRLHPSKYASGVALGCYAETQSDTFLHSMSLKHKYTLKTTTHKKHYTHYRHTRQPAMHRAWVDRVLFSRCKIFMRDDSAGEEEEMKIVRERSRESE